ncbi:hypothetical protein AB6A40_001149 [Gnathostoma spinigerum]|uniref:Uncharacterized protein n=1 Tax=Gnathostoma spinigerum TaxID=75299 RepID=A0ABD6E4J2_9BILA
MSFYWETNRSPLWNNPFLQNDLVAQHSQRYTNISDITAHRSPLTTMELTNSEPSKSPNIAETPPLGFVQRMRQKFDDLSRKAAQSASISPHSRKKRYPSADDILADNDELSFSLANRMVHLPTTTMQENADEIHQSDTIDSFRNESTKTKVSPISRPTSLFQQSVSFDDDEQLIITKPLREVSVLRQKFEEISNFDMFGSIKRVNSNRLRRYNRRHLSDSSLNEPNEETEFIQAYRRLKRSSPIYRHKENTSPYESYDELERKKAKNASYADPTGLLIVGSTARIFFERDITETQRPLLPVRVVDLINPPDPVSARDTYNPNLLEENISFGVQANDYNSPVNDKNQSPPPEEPKPTFLSETDESLPTLTDKTSFISVQTVPPSALIRRDILSAKISDNNCPSDSEKQFPWSRSRPQPNTAVNELDEVRRLVRKFTASREKQAALLDETLQMASPKEIPQPPTIIRQPQITPRYVSFGIRDLPSSTYVVTKLTASPNEYKPLIPEKPVHYGRQLMDRSAVTPAKISSSSTHVVTIVVGDDDSRYFTQGCADFSQKSFVVAI